jgi:dTMP kinase
MFATGIDQGRMRRHDRSGVEPGRLIVFISFEGIDGSGKSTQLTMLREWFEARGSGVMVIREPGATLLSESIREILLSTKQSITPTAELLLFSAARTQLVEKVIEPAQTAGSIILCDRYVDSTTAYQGYGRGLNLDHVAEISRIATRGVMPSLTFFIDVRYEQAQQRMQFAEGAAEPDRMERAGSEFFNRVRDGYLAIAASDPKRFVVVDGYRDRDAIHRDIVTEVEHRL